MAEVSFAGESFTIADRIGLMPLMRFAKVAQSGVDSRELAGLAAMYDLIEQCIAEQDWPRFEKAADRTRADADELMQVVQDVMALVAARPTERPSDSSDGPPATATNSTVASSSPADRFVSMGRPDLAEMVRMSQSVSA